MLAAIAFVGASSVARDATASGFLGARFGADHGNPVNPSPFAIYYNPAALGGGLKGTQVTLDVSAVLRKASYTRSQDALSPSSSGVGDQSYVDSNVGKATLTNVLALPFAGIASDFGGSKLAAGFAVYVPFGGLAEWDKNEKFKGSLTAPGGVDGQQRWQSISGQVLAVYATGAAAYRLHPRVSVGVNVSAVYHHLSTIRARNANNSDDTANGPGATPTDRGVTSEGRSFVDANAITPAAAFGVWFLPTDDLTVGASVSIRPNFGEFRLGGKVKQQFGKQAEDSTSDVEVIQTYPDVFRFGAAYRVNKKLELRLDGDFVTWSAFKNQCIVAKGTNCEVTATGAPKEGTGSNGIIVNIRREWHNAFGVRAGAGYMLTEDLEIFGSGMYDASAVPKETLDPTFIDAPKLIGTIGAKKSFGKIGIAASFTHVQFLPQDTKGKSNLYEYETPSRSPSADGKYNQTFEILNVNGTYSF